MANLPYLLLNMYYTHFVLQVVTVYGHQCWSRRSVSRWWWKVNYADVQFLTLWLFGGFFRCNDDCTREITALAVSAVPSLMKNVISFPTGLLNTLLTSLLETTKVHVYHTFILVDCSIFMEFYIFVIMQKSCICILNYAVKWKLCV